MPKNAEVTFFEKSHYAVELKFYSDRGWVIEFKEIKSSND